MDSKEESKNQQPHRETYQKIKVLGKGGFGKVFLVKCQSDFSVAAIKQINIKTINNEQDLKWIDREI